MKQVIARLVGLYFLFAVIARCAEHMGAVTCDCAPGCWCKRPVLNILRWVAPYGHR